MTSNTTTTPAEAIRKHAEDVIERHHRVYGVNHFTEETIEICNTCRQVHPCDAYTQAQVVLTFTECLSTWERGRSDPDDVLMAVAAGLEGGE